MSISVAIVFIVDLYDLMANTSGAVRNRRASIISMPSSVIRLPASEMRRFRTSSGRERELATSKRSCTAVATLLTFCPPGPEARTKYSGISLSSIVMVRVI